jgi:hypothetical protein
MPAGEQKIGGKVRALQADEDRGNHTEADPG